MPLNNQQLLIGELRKQLAIVIKERNVLLEINDSLQARLDVAQRQAENGQRLIDLIQEIARE